MHKITLYLVIGTASSIGFTLGALCSSAFASWGFIGCIIFGFPLLKKFSDRYFEDEKATTLVPGKLRRIK